MKRKYKYTVYDWDNFILGHFYKKKNALKLMKKPEAKMLVRVRKSDNAISGWAIDDVLIRKEGDKKYA